MDWLREHPEVRTIRVAAADLNGVARGKRMPARFAEKLLTEGTKFPYSVLNMDIWGEDIEDSPLVFKAGDPDGVLMPTERGFMPMPWLDAPTGLLPLWMFHPDGRPYDGCPRQALARVVEDINAVGYGLTLGLHSRNDDTRALVEARDRELANGYGKDVQVALVRAARASLGDKLIRVAPPHRLLDPEAGHA